jgi:GntR family transcriptional regulator
MVDALLRPCLFQDLDHLARAAVAEIAVCHLTGETGGDDVHRQTAFEHVIQRGDGARLPPEREMAGEMAGEMGVAVGTLRRALEALAADGMLERVQGSGNYVKAPPELSGVYELFKLELLTGERRIASGGCGGWTGSPSRRRKSGWMAAWRNGWRRPIWARSFTGSTESGWACGSRGRRIVWAEDRVGLSTWPDWSPVGAAGAPCGYVQRRGWAVDGRWVEISRTWFDTGRATYVNRME